MSIPRLYINCGIPASGKTTFAERLRKQSFNIVIVGRSEIREKFGDYSPAKEFYVVQAMEALVKGYLLSEKDVIVDANHVTIEQRAQVLQWGKDLWSLHNQKVDRAILAYTVNPIESINRDGTRDDPTGVRVINKQAKAYVRPDPREGAKIIWVDPHKTDPLQLETTLGRAAYEYDFREEEEILRERGHKGTNW